MSSESYLARWSAYLSSFNNSIATDKLEPDKSQADKSEVNNLVDEAEEPDGKLVDPER